MTRELASMDGLTNRSAAGLGILDILVLLLVLTLLLLAALAEFPGLDRKAARPRAPVTPTAGE